jgi:diguanylate cyclase (GGDEF)-like protein
MILLPALLVAVGVAILLATTQRTNRLVALLGERRPWASVRNLMGFFSIVYLLIIAFLFLEMPFDRNLILAEVLLLSALLMFLVVRSGYGTIRDIMRLDEFEQLVNTDELTGTFNRRAILYLLDQEFRKAQQFNFPLSIALLEVDGLAEIAGREGPEPVDLLLRETGRVLGESLRQIDLVGRYEEERFLCVLPSTAEGGGRISGARIGSQLHAVRYVTDEQGRLVRDERPDQIRDGIELTATIGIAEIAPDLTRPADLIERAREALEFGQRRGRGRVVTYGDVLAAAAVESGPSPLQAGTA